MPTPSGQISLSDVNVELGLPSTNLISMNNTIVRTLAGAASGTITMGGLRGKSNRVAINLIISSNTQNYNIFANKGLTYIPGKSDVTVTINSGVVVGSALTSSFAMDTGTGWTSGDTINIVNNGTIVGAGGNGGNAPAGGTNASGTDGAGGGTALRLLYATSIQNNNIIGGGGGGGAGGSTGYYGYGGGGGGGAGSISGSGGTGFVNGSSGTNTNGGNGGNGGGGGVGGGGGSAGNNGTNGIGAWYHDIGGGGGGGLGGSGGNGSFTSGVPAPASGGTAGAATSGAGTYGTWLATGTRYGAVN
jgi:hypothetical protein